MTTIKQQDFSMFLVLSTIFALHGCATDTSNLVDEGKVNIETIKSEYGHVSRVSVWGSETETEVIGEIHGSTHGRGHIRGHIDVEIIYPDGSMQVEETFKFHNRGGKSRVIPLSIKFPFVVPEGSTIRIIHHATFISDHD